MELMVIEANKRMGQTTDKCEKCGSFKWVYGGESMMEWDSSRKCHTNIINGEVMPCPTCERDIENLVTEWSKYLHMYTASQRPKGERENEATYNKKMEYLQKIAADQLKFFTEARTVLKVDMDEIGRRLEQYRRIKE